MTRAVYLAIAALALFLSFVGGTSAQNAASPANASGLWADLTDSYLLSNPGQRWFCSTRGWLYLSDSVSGSVSSETISCTTPAGNDLSWAGGPVSNLKRSGNQISFDRATGVFGNSATGCHITATLTADRLKGTQTCMLKYTDPFRMTGSTQASVQGPYEAKRASTDGREISSVGCSRERTIRAQQLASATVILFENRGAEPLTIFALDRNGSRVMPGTLLAPGSSAVQAIPVSNPLTVADARGACRGLYVPSAEPAKVIVR